ncbi:MAG: hypothetical protein PHP02_06620 [Eubacteriales bacterium]|nr:hypothetical protein [Eubacteriales bacterium]
MNENRMSKKPVIVSDKGIQQLSRIPLSSNTFKEAWLQDVLEKEPGILPTGYVDPVYAPLICVAKEVAVGGNSIDNLYISAKGYLVVVETKLWRNPESKRKVISQIIDYAKDLKDWDYSKLDSVFKANHQGQSMFSAMVEKGYQDAEDEAYFVDIVEVNIRKARFLLMIVGDGTREDVEKMIEFINSSIQMHYHFALCELEIYQLGDGSHLIIPQLTTKTSIITRTLYITEQDGKAEPNVEETASPLEAATKRSSRARYRDVEEWASNTKLKDVTPEDMIDFVNDMQDLGFTINPGTADLAIDYKSERYQKNMKCLMLFHDGETAGIQPKSLYSFLGTTEYSGAIADRLLEDLREHLSPNQNYVPYERLQGYYYFTFKHLIEHKEEILRIFEEFIRSF